MKTRILCCAALVLLSSDLQAAPVEWTVASGGNGHWYDLIAGSFRWGPAKADAESESFMQIHGHLLTVSNAAENAFVFSTFGPLITPLHSEDAGVWAGFTDELVEGEWRWIDNTPGIWQDPDNFANPIQTAYVNWVGGEPNDTLQNEDYLSFRETGEWNDYFNGHSMAGYLIEYDVAPVPEPSTAMLAGVGLVAGAIHVLRRRRGLLRQ